MRCGLLNRRRRVARADELSSKVLARYGVGYEVLLQIVG